MTGLFQHTPWLLAGVLLCGCDNVEDSVWVQFNGTDDAMTVWIGSEVPTPALGCGEERSCTDLHSSIEGAVIGSADVEPNWGPVGTVHSVLVVVEDDWEDLVGRVTVEIDGDRDSGEFELNRDPANPGAWGLDLESMGAKNEVRIDSWVVRLWQAVAESEAPTDASSLTTVTSRRAGASDVRPR